MKLMFLPSSCFFLAIILLIILNHFPYHHLALSDVGEFGSCLARWLSGQISLKFSNKSDLVPFFAAGHQDMFFPRSCSSLDKVRSPVKCNSWLQ